MNAGQTTWKQGPSHRLLASFSPCLLTDSALTQNAYIMRTKCAQKRECDIFNSSVTITYNFSTLKCTHFPVCDLNLNRSLNLNPTAPSNSCQFVLIRVSNSKLTETDRFRPKLPGGYYTNKPTYFPACNCAVTQLSTLNPDLTNSKPDHFQTVQGPNFSSFLRKSSKPDRDGLIFDLLDFRAPFDWLE